MDKLLRGSSTIARWKAGDGVIPAPLSARDGRG